jgi:hypothetical protein
MARLPGTRPRMSGNVHPRIPSTAPLSTRLQAEVYALDGLGSDYIVAPGARLEVGNGGRLFESMGDFPGGTKGMIIAGAGVVAAWWLFFRKKKNRRRR